MCEKLEKLPISNPLEIPKNADFQFSTIFYSGVDASGEKIPTDWTGVVFISEIRDKDSTTGGLVATFSMDAGANDGLCIGRLSKATVSIISNKNCFYDVKATQSGQEFPIIHDDILFTNGVTA